MGRRKLNLVGQRFDKLTVLSEDIQQGGRKHNTAEEFFEYYLCKKPL